MSFSFVFDCFSGETQRFQAFSPRNRGKQSVFRRFHAVCRRFLRSRSCSPCFVSGRENSRKRRGAAFSSVKIPKLSPGVPLSTGSGGRARGFRRPAAGAAQDSPRKILRGSSFSSAPLALCEVCLIIEKMLQNYSKINIISIILLKNIFMV